MSEGLRKMHREALKTPEAQGAYAAMCREYKRAMGALNNHAELIIYNIAALEDAKVAYRTDLDTRGVIVTVENGRQKFRKPNRSQVELERVMDKQARLSARLGMVGGRGAGGEAAGDAAREETLDDFDD